MLSRSSRGGRIALIALFGTGLLGTSDANAKARYVFTGTHYTYLYPADGCLTTSMHLTMKIVFPAKLAPNMSNQSVTAISWAISDGLHMFKDTEAKAIAPLQATFTTDGSGKISAWSINSYYYTKNGIDLLYTTHSNTGGDYSADYKCNPSAIGSSSIGGTWKPN